MRQSSDIDHHSIRKELIATAIGLDAAEKDVDSFVIQYHSIRRELTYTYVSFKENESKVKTEIIFNSKKMLH